jgi:orotate phosphoribosyltransferase
VRPGQAALAEVFRKYAIRTGEFTLASGRTSTWYLDGRQVTFRGDCVQIVGRAVVEALSVAGIDEYDSVGGLVVGAVPVAVAVAAVAGVRSFAVRKEAKDHGAGGLFAGPIEPGDRVVVVEDTVTSGGSVLQALRAVQDFGAEVVAVATLLDRGGELEAKLAAEGVAYVPALGAPDLGFAFGS